MQEISRSSPPGRHRYKLRKLASRTRDSFSFHEFSLEEITPIIICTSPLGAPCVHRWKLAPGWNAVNAWNRQQFTKRSFFFFFFFFFFFSSFPNNGTASLYCRWVCIGCGQTSSPCVKLVAIICGFIFKDGREEDGVGWSTVFVANKCTGHGCREAMPSSAFHRVTDAPERRCIDSGCRKRLRGASRWPWFRIIC